MKFVQISTIFVIILSWIASYSQTGLNDFNYQITYVTTGAIDILGDSIYARECGVTIPDTVNISKIHVKVGTADGGGDILNYSFDFDVSAGLPQGLAYVRSGNRVKLHLYETQTSDIYFYELKLEDLLGNISQLKKWH